MESADDQVSPPTYDERTMGKAADWVDFTKLAFNRTKPNSTAQKVGISDRLKQS